MQNTTVGVTAETYVTTKKKEKKKNFKNDRKMFLSPKYILGRNIYKYEESCLSDKSIQRLLGIL